MDLFVSILSILDTKVKTPVPYGGFHITFFLLSVIMGFVFLKTSTHKDEGYFRRFLLIESLIVIIFETYKQINFSFLIAEGQITFDYKWYAFPFQFCSTPMYIGLLAAFVKGNSWHKRLCAYLATYAMFAGICVMVYPTTVFVDTLGINIQTMVCHGSMITVAIVLLGSGYVRAELQTLLNAFHVFLLLVCTAVLMNELAYQTGLLRHDAFNMFFISPHCTPELPVYSVFQKLLPFPLDLAVYIAGFTAASGLILLTAKILHIQTSIPMEMKKNTFAYRH